MIPAGAAFAALLAVAAPARAEAAVGADQTFGSDGYRETGIRASADVGESLYLAPRARFYRSDFTEGTYALLGLRLGYESGPWSLGAEGAVQSKVAGYARSLIGADALYSFSRAEAGAAVASIRHEDEFAAVAGEPDRRNKRASVPRASNFVLRQTDLSALAGLRWALAELTAEATKSLYDRDLDAEGARESRFLELGGFDAVVQGLPDVSANVRLLWKGLALLRPHVSYTRTTFKLGARPSDAYEAGAKARLGKFSLKAAYRRYVQGGYADRHYYTLGAGLEF